MYLAIYSLIILFISLVYINIAPFIYSNTFGHYLRRKTTIYVYRKGNDIYFLNEADTIVEKCNPWLMFWRITKLKPDTYEIKFDSEQTERIWNLINHKE